MVHFLLLDVHPLNLTVFEFSPKDSFLVLSLDILVTFCMCRREMLIQITGRQRLSEMIMAV